MIVTLSPLRVILGMRQYFDHAPGLDLRFVDCGAVMFRDDRDEIFVTLRTPGGERKWEIEWST